MKRFIITLVITISCLQLLAQQDWKLYTNTSHMRDLVEYNGDIVIATWGGLEFYSPIRKTLTNTMTVMDGLKGNDVYALSKYNETELMVAIIDKGVDRFVGYKQDVSLTEAMGLASLNIFAIHSHQDKIFVGSTNGLTVFQKDENISFPVYLNSYNYGYNFQIVNTIASSNDGYIFLGTDAGITRTHTDSLDIRSSWRNYSISGGDCVTSIDVKDDIIAVATNRKAFYINSNRFNWEETTNIARRDYRLLHDNAGFVSIKIHQEQDSFQIYSVFGVWKTWRVDRNYFVSDPQKRSILITTIKSKDEPSDFTSDDEQLSYNADIVYWNTKLGILGAPATNVLINRNDIYITTWGDGLYHINRTTNELVAHAKHNSIQSNYISSMAVDKNSLIWFADGADVGVASPIATKGIASLDVHTNTWNYYTADNSPLLSNNMMGIAVDSQNRKWFGTRWVYHIWVYPDSTGWDNGVSTIDTNGNWRNYSWSVDVRNLHSIGNQIFVSHNTGVVVFSESLQWQHTFQAPSSRDTSVVKKIRDRYYVGTNNGLSIWNANSLPYTNGPSWLRNTPVNEGKTYSIESYFNGYTSQIWFANSSKLTMYDPNFNAWYYYDTDIKRRIYRNNAWETDQLYYSNEDRLWGSEAGVPSCLVIDSFGRVWIGTANSGLAMYDIAEDRFYNYKTTNSPLVSNSIMALVYQPKSGLLYISTPLGVMTTFVGVGEKDTTNLTDIDVFPNPFKPDIHPYVTIKVSDGASLPINSYNECRIFDLTGQLVRSIPENSNNEGIDRFIWDGKTSQGKNCAPGIYFYLIKTSISESAKGKIVLIR